MTFLNKRVNSDLSKAVFDSSALIFSLKVREVFELASKNFSELLVPPAVFSEVIDGGKLRGSPEVKIAEQLFAKGTLKKCAAVAPIASHLGFGEAQALACAKKLGAICLCDDRKAHVVGTALGVKVISLPALLIFALKKKQVTSEKAEELISKLVEQGYYLKTADYLAIVKKIREAPDEN